MAYHEISPGNAHSPSRLCPPHIRPCFPCRYRTLKIIDFSSNTTASYVIPVRQASVSESLFVCLPACGFLQPTPHDANLGVFATCRPANTSPCRVYRGLAPPSKCALPGAHRVGNGVSPVTSHPPGHPVPYHGGSLRCYYSKSSQLSKQY